MNSLSENPPVAQNDETELLEDCVETPVGWDEGGRSHCGYSDGIHDTLMSIGESIHALFGEPGEALQTRMTDIGNYFQEISYATRDLKCGNLSMSDFRNNADDDDVSQLSVRTDDASENGDEVHVEMVGAGIQA